MGGIARDQSVFTRDTRAEIAEAVAAELPDARVVVDADQFDGTATVAHDAPLPDDLAARVARRLRGGRPVDHAAPTDWHVTDERPSDGGWDRQEGGATALSFSRTFPVPAGYDEDARTWLR